MIVLYIQAAKFNESLVAGLDTVAAFREDVYRRVSDGVVTASFINTRAVPVADDYALQLKIFLEFKALDQRTNAELFAGAGVAGLGGGMINVPVYCSGVMPPPSARFVCLISICGSYARWLHPRMNPTTYF
jgi:hypothetical protein